jgi:hypothetical protein
MEYARQADLDAEVRSDAMSSVRELPFLSAPEKSVFARVQRRTYLIALLERALDEGPLRHASAEAVERIVQFRAGSDAECFMRIAGRAFDAVHAEAIHNAMLADYRRQYMRESP